jgi:hypothetical protein
MALLSRIYKRNINGIILTLVFHILVFSGLYFSQMKVRREYKEPEIIIDFSRENIELVATPAKEKAENKASDDKGGHHGQMITNLASNKSSPKQNTKADEQIQKEIEKTQELVKDVSSQLKKEIPTIDGLKMPEAPKADPRKFSDKVYTGESNIVYFMENRYHVKLPIPVYLAEGGGKVKVNIIVDRSGNVVKAEPIAEPTISEQILSYAKTAALLTKFNSDDKAPTLQNGYITYSFIPQR